jgi:glycosyltransferase involved in cell wall biosynthesis
MISLCIPTYNREKFVISAFSRVILDDRITEIVISDDHSDISVFESLSDELKNLKSDKIKLFRNEINKGAFLNKYEAVKNASCEWVILLDSDNIIDVDYLNNIPIEKNADVLYLPSHAICESTYLDYTEFSGKVIEMDEYKKMVNSAEPRIQCLLNTGNYFFNRRSYMDAVETEEIPYESYGVDVFYLIHLWFKSNNSNKLKVVDNMKYLHTLHNGGNEETSHYVKTQSKSSIALTRIIELSNEL